MNLEQIILRLGEEIELKLNALNEALQEYVEEFEEGRKILKAEWWSIYSFMDPRHSMPKPNPFPVTAKYVYIIWRYYMQESGEKKYKKVHSCPDVKMETLLKLIEFFELKLQITNGD